MSGLGSVPQVMPQAKQLCQDEAFEFLECLPWKVSGLGEGEMS